MRDISLIHNTDIYTPFSQKMHLNGIICGFRVVCLLCRHICFLSFPVSPFPGLFGCNKQPFSISLKLSRENYMESELLYTK